MKIKAEHISELPPGSVVRINGIEWVRLADAESIHFVGVLCNPETGYWTSWQGLVFMDDEVEVLKRGETK